LFHLYKLDFFQKMMGKAVLFGRSTAKQPAAAIHCCKRKSRLVAGFGGSGT
jgi:hypothetical protein